MCSKRTLDYRSIEESALINGTDHGMTAIQVVPFHTGAHWGPIDPCPSFRAFGNPQIPAVLHVGILTEISETCWIGASASNIQGDRCSFGRGSSKDESCREMIPA